MNNMYADVGEFQEKFKAYEKPITKMQKLDKLSHVIEEVCEAVKAVENDDNAQLLDAVIDIIYVALGIAWVNDFDFNEGWKRVHKANMNKKSGSTKRAKFDVIKPEGWIAPKLEDLV